jgi:hypothetical protein
MTSFNIPHFTVIIVLILPLCVGASAAFIARIVELSEAAVFRRVCTGLASAIHFHQVVVDHVCALV